MRIFGLIIARDTADNRNLANRSAMLKSKLDGLENQRDMLQEQVSQLKHTLDDHEQKMRRKEEETKHYLKMEEQRRELEMEKYKATCNRERDEAIAKVKDSYRDKTEKYLHEQVQRGQDMYNEILARLPNVSVRLKGDV